MWIRTSLTRSEDGKKSIRKKTEDWLLMGVCSLPSLGTSVSRSTEMEETMEFKLWILPCKHWPRLLGKQDCQDPEAKELSSPHCLSSCLENSGNTLVQLYPNFSCSLLCHLAVRAESLCCGMGPSSSQPLPSALDSSTAWRETCLKKPQNIIRMPMEWSSIIQVSRICQLLLFSAQRESCGLQQKRKLETF